MIFEFSEKINKFLKIILKNAQMQNKRVFFVGGIVRDKILDNSILDIDLLFLGNAIEFAKSLPDEIKIKSIHEDFCTVKLLYEDIEIDIASSRSETYPHSGCLPVVLEIGVPLEKDVSRRDFSINSIYCELKLDDETISFQMIDLVEGIKDIESKKLKALHSKSYIDDPTRIIRGVGFKYRFGFDFSEDDKKLINAYLQNVDYFNMSFDRNSKVILKTLDSKFRDEIFKEIVEKKYYKIINSRNLEVDFDFLNEIIESFGLNHLEICQLYLKVLIDRTMDDFNICEKMECFHIFSKMNIVDLAYYLYKTRNKNVNWYLTKKDISLNIDGRDLLGLGYKQGAIIGEILNALYSEKLETPELFQEKQNEIDWVLKAFPNN